MIDQKSNIPLSRTNSAVSHNTGFAIWHVVNLWQKIQKDALSPFNITPVQFLLIAGLAELSANNNDIKQSTLAQHCRTDAMMTSQVIRTLEKRGLVRRTQHRKDGRAIAVQLTEFGQNQFATATPAVAQADAQFFIGLGDRVDEFTDALAMLAGEKRRRRVKAIGQ
ncbi:MAG: MarR family winged helix-turn-helix transcriptional regulator [Alphaproteobacteria bacterium]